MCSDALHGASNHWLNLLLTLRPIIGLARIAAALRCSDVPRGCAPCLRDQRRHPAQQGRTAAGLVLLVLHLGAWELADSMIMAEIPGTHAYVAALSVLGGIATFNNPLQVCTRQCTDLRVSQPQHLDIPSRELRRWPRR